MMGVGYGLAKAIAQRLRNLGFALLLALTAVPGVASEGLFLWEVQGSKARHYFMGSVHLLPPTAYPLPAAYSAAYEAADALVFESDLAALSSPELQAELLAAARAERPGSMKARLQPPLYEALQRRAAAIGMPVQACDGYKPWFCALTLELFAVQRAGFDAQYGVDQHFYSRAAADNKPVGWLEAPEVQARFFSQMSERLSLDLLAATLDEATDTAQSPDELLRLWQQGDTALLAQLVHELRGRYPQLYQRLFAQRNHAWMPKLRQRLEGTESVLVIVGAAHYAGPEGLLALLKNAGYQPRRVAAPSPALASAARDPRPDDRSFLIPELACRDPEAAFAFYQKAFGFQAGLVLRNAEGRLERGELKFRNARLTLVGEGGAWKRRAPEARKPPPTQLYLYVEDVERALAAARAAGAEVLQTPQLEGRGERLAVVRDPEGYVWALATHSPRENPPQPEAP